MSILSQNQSGYQAGDIQKQGDRIAELLRTAASQQPQPSLGERYMGQVASMGEAHRIGGRPLDAYQKSMNTASQNSQNAFKTQLGAETGIYDIMQKQAQEGNAKVKAVMDSIAAYTSDPIEQGKIIEALHNDPEELDESNMYVKIPATIAKLGIKPKRKVDYKVVGPNVFNPEDGTFITGPEDAKDKLNNEKTQAEIDVIKGGGQQARTDNIKKSNEAQGALQTIDLIRNHLHKINGAKIGPVAGRITGMFDSDIQTLDSLSNQLTLQAKSLLNMPSANFSDADRSFLEKIVGGSKVSKDALLQNLDNLETLAIKAGAGESSNNGQQINRKIRVSNGKETFEIDSSDLGEAQAEGFGVVE